MADNMRLYQYVEMGKGELNDYLRDNPEAIESEVQGQVQESADTLTPIYTGDILGLAHENHFLAYASEENQGSPIEVIQANIYQYLYQELAKHWEEVKEESAENEGDMSILVDEWDEFDVMRYLAASDEERVKMAGAWRGDWPVILVGDEELAELILEELREVGHA